MSNYSRNALSIYRQLYFAEGERTPEDVHDRVARRIGDNPDQVDNFRHILNNKGFRPNTPCLINAGRPGANKHNHQYCACFVLGLEDSMESIIKMWETVAIIYASGAGAGIPITNLREKGAPISAGGMASGPVKYLGVIEAIANTVQSGGRTRRAANKADFMFDHPDNFQIVNAKVDGTLKAFNLSMMVTDEFMQGIERRMGQANPEPFTMPYRSPVGHTKGTFDGWMLWTNVIHNAWLRGDPGLQFFDTTNSFNPFPSLGLIEATNACGEVPLPPWSACNLGAFNLNNCLKWNKDKSCWEIDWDIFDNYVWIGMQFLDNVIDKTSYLNDQFEAQLKRLRPTGLGFFGWADALYKMGITYGSQESIDLFELVCWRMTREAIRSSIRMVAELGKEPIEVPEADQEHFRNLLAYYTSPIRKDAKVQIVGGKYFGTDEHNDILDLYDKHGIRNSTWTCLAPTGSTALSADASYAWEPQMALVWDKPLTETDEVLAITDPHFLSLLPEIAESCNREIAEIMNDIRANKGSIQHLTYIPQKYRDLFVVAHDIDPMTKLQMQAVGQKWISLAISNTLNLPNSATPEDIARCYVEAWKLGLKGVTVFRDECLNEQVVHFGQQYGPGKTTKAATTSTVAISAQELFHNYKRPITLYGPTVCIEALAHKLYVTANWDRGHMVEVFLRMGKQGAEVTVLLDTLARMISKELQRAARLEDVIDAMEDMKSSPIWMRPDDSVERTIAAESVVDAVAKVLLWHHTHPPLEVIRGELDEVAQDILDRRVAGEFLECPSCGKKGLRIDMGCKGGTCVICHWNSCSG